MPYSDGIPMFIFPTFLISNFYRKRPICTLNVYYVRNHWITNYVVEFRVNTVFTLNSDEENKQEIDKRVTRIAKEATISSLVIR